MSGAEFVVAPCGGKGLNPMAGKKDKKDDKDKKDKKKDKKGK